MFRARVPTFAFERIKDAVYSHRLHGCGVDESEEEVRGNEMSRHVLRLWTALANGRIEGRALILLAKTPRGLGGWIKVAPDPDSPPVSGVPRYQARLQYQQLNCCTIGIYGSLQAGQRLQHTNRLLSSGPSSSS